MIVVLKEEHNGVFASQEALHAEWVFVVKPDNRVMVYGNGGLEKGATPVEFDNLVEAWNCVSELKSGEIE